MRLPDSSAGLDVFDELPGIRQRRTDIEATIDNLLDNITSTNRDYVDRRIEKLRDELVALERQEAALLGQQDRERQAQVLAERAFALMRSFDRLAEVGTVDEKRSVVRAFLRGMDYNPESSSGKAHFWLIPNAQADGGQSTPGGPGSAHRCDRKQAKCRPDGGRRQCASSFPLGSGGWILRPLHVSGGPDLRAPGDPETNRTNIDGGRHLRQTAAEGAFTVPKPKSGGAEDPTIEPAGLWTRSGSWWPAGDGSRVRIPGVLRSHS